jgi:erythromycin esterase-like protein
MEPLSRAPRSRAPVWKPPRHAKDGQAYRRAHGTTTTHQRLLRRVASHTFSLRAPATGGSTTTISSARLPRC